MPDNTSIRSSEVIAKRLKESADMYKKAEDDFVKDIAKVPSSEDQYEALSRAHQTRISGISKAADWIDYHKHTLHQDFRERILENVKDLNKKKETAEKDFLAARQAYNAKK